MTPRRSSKRTLPGWIAFCLRHRRRLLRSAAVFAVVGAIGVPTVWLTVLGGAEIVAEAAKASFVAASRATGLSVREIRLSGRRHADRTALMAAIGVARDAPILAVDLARLRARIENLGWVEQARVSRRLPDILEIQIDERIPFARWQHEGRLVVIDHDGVVITEHQLESYAELPLVVGPDAAEEAAPLIDMMASDPGLLARVTAAVRVGGRRWNLTLDNGIDVLLPEDATDAAWRRLSALHRSDKILERDVTVIDLRVEDRVFLKLPPETAARVRDPGEST